MIIMQLLFIITRNMSETVPEARGGHLDGWGVSGSREVDSLRPTGTP